MLTSEEIKELKMFEQRRAFFGGELDIMNVHNVPDSFPHIYVALYGNMTHDLFCLNGPAYSDYDKTRAKEFEDYLTKYEEQRDELQRI